MVNKYNLLCVFVISHQLTASPSNIFARLLWNAKKNCGFPPFKALATVRRLVCISCNGQTIVGCCTTVRSSLVSYTAVKDWGYVFFVWSPPQIREKGYCFTCFEILNLISNVWLSPNNFTTFIFLGDRYFCEFYFFQNSRSNFDHLYDSEKSCSLSK